MKKFMLDFSLMLITLYLFKPFLYTAQIENKEKSEKPSIPNKIYNGIRLWQPNIDKNTPLDIKIATEQLNKFLSEKNNLEAKNEYGQTLLILAVIQFHQQALVKHLLDLGANIEAKDNFINLITGKMGNNALTMAIYNRNSKTAKILLEYGAKIDYRYIDYAQSRYDHYKKEKGEEHKAEGFKQILDLLKDYTAYSKEIFKASGLPSGLIESIILPYSK